MRQVRPPSRPSDARDAIRAHPLDPEREQARPERCAPHFGLVATPPPKAPPTSPEAPPISLCPAPPPPAGRTPVKTPPPNRPRLLWPRPVSHVGHAPCLPCAPIGPNPFLAPSFLTLPPNHTSPHFLTTPTAVAPPNLFSLIGSDPPLSPSPSHRAPQSHPPAHTSWPRPLHHPRSPIGSGPLLTPPPPAVPPVMAGGVPGSVAVALHPLVILNISDHWIRMRCQEGRPGQGENPMEPHRDP